MIRGKLVIVEWGDAWGRAYWADLGGLRDECKSLLVTTVGWVIESNKEGMLLAASICPETKCSPLHAFIPKGMIRKVTSVGTKFNLKDIE